MIFSMRERSERLVAGNFYGTLWSAPLRSNITPRLSERSDQGRGNISLRFNESDRKIVEVYALVALADHNILMICLDAIVSPV